MEALKEIIVNRFPQKTWSSLKLNETKIQWPEKTNNCLFLVDDSKTENVFINTPKENNKPYIITVDKNNSAYTNGIIEISANDNSEITVIEIFENEQNALSCKTNIHVNKKAKITLFQLFIHKKILINDINVDSQKEGTTNIVQFFLGSGSTYSNCNVSLLGDESTLNLDSGYFQKENQSLDINIVANHFGKKTKSNINIEGTLSDNAKKTFKGTIDFKTGSSDSEGHEQENVLFLGDQVINKSLPVILCNEENVQGTHGASLGEIDKDVVYYFQSRGFSKKQTEIILAKSKLQKLSNKITTDKTHQLVNNIINEAFSNEQ